MEESNLVKLEIKPIPESYLKKFDVHSLTDVHKNIFLKYLKFDFQLASNPNGNKSVCALMVTELNKTDVTLSKDVWLRLLKSWFNYVKSNVFDSFIDAPSDKILKEMLDDEFLLVNLSTHQLSCILNNLIGKKSPNVWKNISHELSDTTEKKSDLYWMKSFAVAKQRIAIKSEIVESLRINEIENTGDLQMTELENRLLDMFPQERKNIKHENEDDDRSRCRICLVQGTDFVSLFKEEHETPSIIDKLMECSRISQISEDDGFPQSICANCLSQLEIAYQFRILSEISEHKLKNKILCYDNTTSVMDFIEECDDGKSFNDDHGMDKTDELQNWDDKDQEKQYKDEEQAVLLQCETCGLTFDSPKLLKKHIRSHVIAPISSRECKICSKVFKSEALLRAHGRTHSDLRPYICETCGKCFKTTSQLASHCLTHSDVKNFQCPNCSYRGNTNNNLRIHLRTHTRVQPYSCRFCQWKFSTASNMQKHIRNIHHKMRNHQCTECSKSFFAKESLRKHMVTHTGIKLYSCSVCSASYAWYNGLKKHMRIQHAGEKCPSEITFRPTKSMC